MDTYDTLTSQGRKGEVERSVAILRLLLILILRNTFFFVKRYEGGQRVGWSLSFLRRTSFFYTVVLSPGRVEVRHRPVGVVKRNRSWVQEMSAFLGQENDEPTLYPLGSQLDSESMVIERGTSPGFICPSLRVSFVPLYTPNGLGSDTKVPFSSSPLGVCSTPLSLLFLL